MEKGLSAGYGSPWMSLRAFRTMIGFGFEADWRQHVTLFGSTFIGQATGLAATYGAKLLTDSVLRLDLNGVLLAATMSAACGAIASLCGRAYVKLTITIQEKAGQLIDRHLVRLIGRMPGLEHHERPEYIDELNLLRGQRSLLVQANNSLVLNFRVWLQLIGGAILLSQLMPVLALLPLFGIGSVLAGRKAHQLEEATREANTERSRLKGHLFGMATSSRAGMEVRVFGLADEIIGRHQVVATELQKATHRTAWQGTGLRILGSLLFAVGYVGAIALVLVRAVGGAATPGDVVLAISLAAQMNGTVGMIVDWGDYLRRAIKAATRYLWLVDYAAQATASLVPSGKAPLPAPERLFRGIDLVNVTFRYPGTAPDGPPVLADVNLHLPAGKMVALVGENGAGKTSIVKLLSRFYDPLEGEILLDGAPLRRLDIDGWRARLSAGFQDFARLQFLAAESVGAGELSKIEDRGAVGRAVELGGAAEVVAGLPAGLETQLGKQWDGGAELSGGQWQKLALARAAMRWGPETHPLVILFDEPTAALDAQTEYALFERMAEAARSGEARGAVTLVVSHRFSTVRMADVIVVIDKGRVVECGSHEELMRNRGLYAELYSLQARAYA